MERKRDKMKDKEKVSFQIYGDRIGNFCIGIFNYAGLFAISAIIFWASFNEFVKIISSGVPNIENILTLFIYLELGAMVGIYFKTKHLPIRFLLYIAITAMTRHLIGVITDHGNDIKLILAYCGGTLIICISVLLIRIGTSKYPSIKEDDK